MTEEIRMQADNHFIFDSKKLTIIMRKLITTGFVLVLIFTQGLKAQQPNMIDELREARLDSLLNEVFFELISAQYFDKFLFKSEKRVLIVDTSVVFKINNHSSPP